MINIEQVLQFHKRLEDLQLCLPGVRDTKLLESSVYNSQWYEDIYDQVIYIAFAINSSHVFNDGNKRTSFILLKQLCSKNIMFDNERISNAILGVARSELDKDDFFREVKNTRIDHNP